MAQRAHRPASSGRSDLEPFVSNSTRLSATVGIVVASHLYKFRQPLGVHEIVAIHDSNPFAVCKRERLVACGGWSPQYDKPTPAPMEPVAVTPPRQPFLPYPRDLTAVPAQASSRHAIVGIVAPHHRDQVGALVRNRLMSVGPTPSRHHRQRASVTVLVARRIIGNDDFKIPQALALGGPDGIGQMWRAIIVGHDNAKGRWTCAVDALIA